MAKHPENPRLAELRALGQEMRARPRAEPVLLDTDLNAGVTDPETLPGHAGPWTQPLRPVPTSPIPDIPHGNPVEGRAERAEAFAKALGLDGAPR